MTIMSMVIVFLCRRDPEAPFGLTKQELCSAPPKAFYGR